MLSIQVHPTKEYAKVAFEKEEAAGISLNAPNRNYKDTNYKPEIMLAMSEFWLLHGFKSEAKILETLENIAEFQVLVPLYKSEGLKGLYQFLMEMEQAQVDSLPLKRGPSLDEFGRTIRFLFDTPSITGQMIALDGGQHLIWNGTEINE